MPVDIDPGQDHDANLLAAFLENRLSPDERREMERHLADCRDCRETLAASSTLSSPSEKPTAFRMPVWLAAAATLAVAGWFGYRTFTIERPSAPDSPRQSPSAAVSPAAPDAPAPLPAIVPPPSGSAPQAPRAGEAEEPLATKRGSERRIGSKTFRFVAGEWVDSAFDPTAGLPVVEARTAGERRALVGRVPALAPFARMSGRVTVVVDGTVYLFLP